MKLLIFLIAFIQLVNVSSAGPNECIYTRTQYRRAYRHCGLFGWSRCGYYYPYTQRYTACCHGWRKSSNGLCTDPICTTPCYNGGTCIGPDQCKCLPSHNDGNHCSTLLCSHQYPCYPGVCSYPHHCKCYPGFTGTNCLQFDGQNNKPEITQCKLTLAHVRRTDDKELFNFTIPCSNGSTQTMWSNQELFNYAQYTMDSYYPPIHQLPPAPDYVTRHGFGIVRSTVHVKHEKFPRDGGTTRFVARDHTHICPGVSNGSPEKDIFSCDILNEDYKINIEHDDIFTVVYSTTSGGYHQLYDIDHHRDYRTNYYTGDSVSQSIVFRFDFIAPVHCSEPNATAKCQPGDKPIDIGPDVTKSTIQPRASGWSDELSGIAYYYLEIFRLEPNINNDLVELEPLNPLFTHRATQTSPLQLPAYTPTTSGMYSILLQASDMANNSKIARTLVLYDNESHIELAMPGLISGKPMDVSDMRIGDGGMHVISALPETGYMWQTSPGRRLNVVIDWKDHFVNRLMENQKLLNRVLPYPTQFADLQDDGILRSKKYVALDDHDGRRQLTAIPNKRGIVRFQIFTDQAKVATEPTSWLDHPLVEHYEQPNLTMVGGEVFRLWVKATDMMNNSMVDYTEVHVDNTTPRLDHTDVKLNIHNGTYTYTTRATFSASDEESGVHKIQYQLYTDDGITLLREGNVSGHTNMAPDACNTDSTCNCVLYTCYLPQQTVDIDNCWFLVPKQHLNKSASIVVTVFNQALLSRQFTYNVSQLTDLQGLEEYSGPTNIRVEKNLASGVRLVWDLPENPSCYGRADINIVIMKQDGSVRVVHVFNEETSVDLVDLAPDEQYHVSLKLGYQGTELASIPYAFKTAPKENYLTGGVIAGIVIGMMLVIGILSAIFVVLLRRGHMQPVRRSLSAMTVRYRKSLANHKPKARSNDYQDTPNNTDSLYMYGDMDFSDIKNWHMSRDDLTFESLMISGHFADIYRAKINSTGETVVAKTLKEGYSEQDAYLMKAKINFNAIVVGQHENVLRLVGAVVSDTDIGSFIVYELCSNGVLRDYLETLRNNITVETQEKLLRFGLGIARGIEYLAQRKIVHRRLAARNILLDEQLEVKITGFGPQPDEHTEGDGQANKKERIPIKWMAPECLKSTSQATEKSDVWSYGIVLWEIFSLGAAPYSNYRGREIPALLKGGYRLPKPEQCEDKWYAMMKKAWSENSTKRPTFSEIRKELDEIFVSASQDEYYYYRK